MKDERAYSAWVVGVLILGGVLHHPLSPRPKAAASGEHHEHHTESGSDFCLLLQPDFHALEFRMASGFPALLAY